MIHISEDTIAYNFLPIKDNRIQIGNNETDRLQQPFQYDMGSYLEPSVKQYYCQVISTSFCFLTDQGVTGQLMSDIPNEGNIPYAYQSADNLQVKLFATSPQIFIKKASGTQSRTLSLPILTFVCDNFNQKRKTFVISNNRVSAPYSINLRDNAVIYGSLDERKVYAGVNAANSVLNDLIGVTPYFCILMTPIREGKIPKPLKYSLTYTITSAERTSGTYGLDCVIPFRPINGGFTHYKALVKNIVYRNKTIALESTNFNLAFCFNLVAYGLNQSGYGLGGDKNDPDACVLGQMMPFMNARVAWDNGNGDLGVAPPLRDSGFLTIKDYPPNQDIRYKVVLDKFRDINHTIDVIGAGDYPYGALLNDDNGTQIEWIVTLELFGYNA